MRLSGPSGGAFDAFSFALRLVLPIFFSDVGGSGIAGCLIQIKSSYRQPKSARNVDSQALFISQRFQAAFRARQRSFLSFSYSFLTSPSLPSIALSSPPYGPQFRSASPRGHGKEIHFQKRPSLRHCSRTRYPHPSFTRHPLIV